MGGERAERGDTVISTKVSLDQMPVCGLTTGLVVTGLAIISLFDFDFDFSKFKSASVMAKIQQSRPFCAREKARVVFSSPLA